MIKHCVSTEIVATEQTFKKKICSQKRNGEQLERRTQIANG
jgi:hypothetical protein